MAFFLFVLAVRTQSTKQDSSAMDDLCLRCAELATGSLTALGSREHVRALLDSRVDMYIESVNRGERKNIVSFFYTHWSPLKNQLALAREGNITGPADVAPIVVSGILDDFRRWPGWPALYTHFVVPFMMVLSAVLEDNTDYRLLPVSEIKRRIGHALEKAAELAATAGEASRLPPDE